MTDTLQTLKKIIAKKFSRDPDVITAESTMEELELDSLEIFDLIFEAETAFKIRVPDYQIDIKTLQDVVNMIDKLIKEQHPV